jgi:hypothetical protein
MTQPLGCWMLWYAAAPLPTVWASGPGEGQALPSAPHFVESGQLWVSILRLGYSSRVQEGLHGDSAPGVQYASVCCSLPSPQCGHLAPGEGQSLPSAPYSMESCQLCVNKSNIGCSIRVQDVLQGGSAPGMQATNVCCSPPPHSVGI